MTHVTKRERDEVAELEGVLKAIVNRRRVTLSDMNDKALYERRREDLVKSRDSLQRQIDDLDERHHNGPAIVDECDAEIVKLRDRINHMKHHREIARMESLTEQMEALRKEMGEEAFQKMLAMMAATQTEGGAG